jgi:hypothetical protein
MQGLTQPDYLIAPNLPGASGAVLSLFQILNKKKTEDDSYLRSREMAPCGSRALKVGIYAGYVALPFKR